MSDYEVPDYAPWNCAPNTIEQMLDTSQQLLEWESKHGRKVPRMWCPMLTTAFVNDLLTRVHALEKAVLQ